jgi:hypothetical protein
VAVNYLTDADKRVLREMVVEYRNRKVNTTGRTTPEDAKPQTTHAYIARTPTCGIRGRVGNTVGRADCAVYTVINGVFQSVDVVLEVVNTSVEDITGDSFVPIAREKFGTWVATGSVYGTTCEDTFPVDGTDTGTGSLGTGTGEAGTGDTGTGTFGTGTGGGGGVDPHTSGRSCALAGLRTTDCLVAISGSQQLKLTYQGGRWNSIPADYVPGTGSGTTTPGSYLLDYLGSSGPVEFWYEAGKLHLSVGGLEMLDCGNGCFSGGELTGHVEPAEGTATVVPCTGGTFSVCVECTSCDEEVVGTSTSGTGGPPFGTGTGVVSTVCCAGRLLPNDLYMTVDCDCPAVVLSTHKMTWNGTYWNTGTVYERSGDRNANEYHLSCESGVWHMTSPTSTCLNSGATHVASSAVCDPLELVFDYLISSNYAPDGCDVCVMGQPVTITITE